MCCTRPAIERANSQLAGYQETLAAYHGRPGLPTCATPRGRSAWPTNWPSPRAGVDQRPPSCGRLVNRSSRSSERTSSLRSTHLRPPGRYIRDPFHDMRISTA